MALTTTTDTPSNAAAPLLLVARHIAQALDTFAQVRSRRGEIMRLLDLSDDQLAARGLTRDQIVQHVYRDRLGM
jgi:uncharacterized protein YjiS (DUF1127 family)